MAIAVIHGMGSQGSDKPTGGPLKFSRPLYNKIAKIIGKKKLFNEVAWREIFWSDILQERQKDFLKEIKDETRYGWIRKFVLCNLSDASAYRIPAHGDKRDTTYKDIHDRVHATIKALRSDVEEGAPLIILAHSLGGHIISNHIWELTKGGTQQGQKFEDFETLTAFVTFGCNIPIFTFAYKKDDVFPISFPGSKATKKKLRTNPWWFNYYDKDDVLGYPLAPINDSYRALVTNGDLEENEIDTGRWFSSWNPASHNEYWTDKDFYGPVAKIIKRVLKDFG